MADVTAEVLKIQREILAVKNAQCSDFLKTKMLQELNARLRAIELRVAEDPAVQAGKAPQGPESRGVKGAGGPAL